MIKQKNFKETQRLGGLSEVGYFYLGQEQERRCGGKIAELPRRVHPFFLGTQFHPEFQARPLAPHPLFTEFIKAASSKRKKK